MKLNYNDFGKSFLLQTLLTIILMVLGFLIGWLGAQAYTMLKMRGLIGEDSRPLEIVTPPCEEIQEGEEQLKGTSLLETKILEMPHHRAVFWRGEANVTGYCLNNQPMASGKMPYKGAVACPRRIPLGTQVIIKGKKYICEDRLASRFDNRFDIWFPSCDEALKWGKQRLAVQILNDQVQGADIFLPRKVVRETRNHQHTVFDD